MTPRPTCPVWRPQDCSGSPNCPPRCPRFIGPDGTAYTVYRRDEDGSATREPTTESDATRLGREPALELVGPSGTAGTATTVSDGEARIELAGEADPIVGTELVRQLVAEWVERPSDAQYRVTGPAAPLERAAAEFGDAGRLDRDGPGTDRRRLTVDPAAEGIGHVATAPAGRGDVAVGDDLTALFAPDRVAVVGATDREGSIGRVLVENLATRFDGEVVPVTPNHESVRDVPAVDSIEAIDGRVDLGVVIRPSEAALEAVKSLAGIGVETVAVLAAGFAEAGDEGADRERRLREAVDERGLTLIGPNALGVLSTRSGLNASFGPTLPDEGGVSIASHSGALITALLDWAGAAGVGVRDVASIGNGVGVDAVDLLRHWGRDPETDVVAAYLEDVADGRAFVDVAREVSATTPIVALKSGRTETGAAAAASHTAALVGDDAGFDAAFDAANVIRVEKETELTDTVSLLANGPLPTGERVAIVTNAGGPGVLAADAIGRTSLDPAPLTDETEAALRDRLPGPAAVGNPIDVLGDADVDRFRDALETTLVDPTVDAAIVLTTPHPLVSRAELARAVGDCRNRYGKPVVTGFLGGDLPAAVRNALDGADVANYPDVDRAAKALANAATYAASRQESRRTPARPTLDADPVAGAIERASAADVETLGVDALSALEGYGVDTPPGEIVTDGETAREVADRLDGPFVCKVATPQLVHKTDHGGVAVDVPAAAVPETVAELRDAARSAAPSLDGPTEGIPVLVQERVDAAVECLVGITRHPRFGPMVTFGLGGVLVEHVDDVSHALAPLSRADARALCDGIDAASVFDGVRGSPPVDRDALERALVGLSWLVVDHPEIAECEVNPLFASDDGVAAVDFHAELDTGGSDRAE